MAKKDDVRPIYQELKGYLSQAPPGDDPHAVSYDPGLWDPANAAIDELTALTGDNTYGRMKIVPEATTTMKSGKMVWIAAYRSKLGGVITRLHGDYFPDEPEPFSSSPDQVMTQIQSQDQSTDVRVIITLEIQEKIIERLRDETLSDVERGFLETVKDSIRGVKSVTELVSLILSTAQSMGVELENLSELFR